MRVAHQWPEETIDGVKNTAKVSITNSFREIYEMVPIHERVDFLYTMLATALDDEDVNRQRNAQHASNEDTMMYVQAQLGVMEESVSVLVKTFLSKDHDGLTADYNCFICMLDETEQTKFGIGFPIN